MIELVCDDLGLEWARRTLSTRRFTSMFRELAIHGACSQAQELKAHEPWRAIVNIRLAPFGDRIHL